MADAAALKELVPTGRLRLAIAVAPSPSAQFAVKDGDGYRGWPSPLAVHWPNGSACRSKSSRIRLPAKYRTRHRPIVGMLPFSGR